MCYSILSHGVFNIVRERERKREREERERESTNGAREGKRKDRNMICSLGTNHVTYISLYKMLNSRPSIQKLFFTNILCLFCKKFHQNRNKQENK